MFFGRKIPGWALAALVGGVALAAAGEWWRLQNAIWQARLLGQAKRQECAALRQREPAVSEENARFVGQDVLLAEQRISEWRGLTAPVVPAPATYFALANWVTEWRERAAAAHVAVKPEQRFGFAAYAGAAPANEVAEQVGRQRALLEPVLAALLAAEPRALTAVQRQKTKDGSGEIGEDYFEPAASALVLPAGVERTTFRVEFFGTTQTLRAFANGLARLPGPVLLREVSAAPEEISGPLVAAVTTRFAVVVDCLWATAEKSGGAQP